MDASATCPNCGMDTLNIFDPITQDGVIVAGVWTCVLCDYQEVVSYDRV